MKKIDSPIESDVMKKERVFACVCASVCARERERKRELCKKQSDWIMCMLKLESKRVLV